jgi:3-hydroxyacyl-CoA dehydrogenase/enoyl-CoA hydratase/3-hydroxybutyryl-CoA epimerase
MGPIELADVVGLDVATHVGEIIAAELGRPAPDLTRLRELVAAGKLGRKSGAGFYVWKDGKPVKGAAYTAPLGNSQRSARRSGSQDESRAQGPPADLIDRLILVLVNECVACLREGVVEEPDLVDAAVIFGTGFAPFRGGPLAYAHTRGIEAVVARLQELSSRYGARFTPDAEWSQLGGKA